MKGNGPSGRIAMVAIGASLMVGMLLALAYYAGHQQGYGVGHAAANAERDAAKAIADVTSVPLRSVPCVAEDACTLDYRDGAWHVGPDGSGYDSEAHCDGQPVRRGAQWYACADGVWYMWAPDAASWVPMTSVVDGMPPE